MGIKNLPQIARAADVARGRDADEPGGGDRARHAARAAHGRGHAGRRSPARAEAEGVRAAGDHAWSGPVAALRERLAWLERRPLHGEVVAVTRARAQASGLAAAPARAGRRGRRGARDPDRAAAGRGRAARCDRPDRRVRARLLHEPERRAPALRARSLPTDAMLARWPGRRVRRHRTRHRRGARSTHGIARRRRARALRRGGPGRGARGRASSMAGGCSWRAAAEARDVLPDALRERGAQVDDVALYDTVAEPLGDAERAGLERATYVTFTSSSTVRFFLEAAAVRPPAGARIVSIGPVTSATAARARPRGGRRGRAARHRRPRRRPGGRCREHAGRPALIVTLLTDYGRDDDFVGVCHGVIRGIHPDARRSWTSPTASRATPCAQGALVLRNTLPYMPVGVHVAVVDPQVGTERRARRAAHRRRARARRARTTGCSASPGSAAAGVEIAVDITPLAAPARAGLGDVPRARHLRPGRRASRRGRRAGGRGRPARPGRPRSASTCRSRARRTAPRGARAA